MLLFELFLIQYPSWLWAVPNSFQHKELYLLLVAVYHSLVDQSLRIEVPLPESDSVYIVCTGHAGEQSSYLFGLVDLLFL